MITQEPLLPILQLGREVDQSEIGSVSKAGARWELRKKFFSLISLGNAQVILF